MDNHHLINSAVIDINYAGGLVTLKQQSEVDSFVKNTLMDTVDEAFNELDSTETVFRIESLEIDLGSIPYQDFRQKMSGILREQLVRALQKLFHTEQNKLLANIVQRRKITNQEDQLYYFLKHGYLPWYSRSDSDEIIEALLISIIQSQPEKLLRFIHTAEPGTRVIERITKQFSNNVFNQILRLQGLPTGKSYTVDTSLLELEQRYLQLIPEPGFESSTIKYEAAYSKLVLALISCTGVNIESSWIELRKKHGPLVKKALLHYGQQEKTRQYLAHSFSQTMLSDALQILEPENYQYLRAVPEHADLFSSAMRKLSSKSSLDNVRVWELTLGYLLVEQSGIFDKKSYLNSLIKQISLIGNIPRHTYLDNLIKEFNSSTEVNKFTWEILGGLSELLTTENKTKRREMLNPVTSASSYVEYERVKAAVSSVSPLSRCDETVLLNDIKQLRQNIPWLLMRLFRELQAGSFPWQSVMGDLSVAFLREFTDALLSLTDQSVSIHPGELAKAVKKNAEKSPSPASFYLHILNCLIKDQLIDFESIKSDREVIFENDDQSNDMSTWEVTTPPTSEQARDIVSKSLAGDYQSFGAAKLLVLSVESMLINQPMTLSQLIESKIREPGSIINFIKYLPERLLAEILSIIGVVDADKILQVAELLNLACDRDEIKLSEKQLVQNKWQFIFQYIADTGRLYNEQKFVHQYIETLNQKVATSEKQQFKSTLSKQLKKNVLSSTREVTQKILQIISNQSADIQRPPALSDSNLSKLNQSIDIADDQIITEDIYISNAGIVLAIPYLPRVFDRFNLIENSGFKDRNAAERGIHLLQYLVNQSVSSPEYQLVLNKLLCGVRPGLPICRNIELSEPEKQQLDSLLLAMIEHWKALGNTSITGLRESFLQRHGRLQLKKNAWYLSVESKSFDLLLDQIPWSYSTIKFPWMDRVMYVEWR